MSSKKNKKLPIKIGNNINLDPNDSNNSDDSDDSNNLHVKNKKNIKNITKKYIVESDNSDNSDDSNNESDNSNNDFNSSNNEFSNSSNDSDNKINHYFNVKSMDKSSDELDTSKKIVNDNFILPKKINDKLKKTTKNSNEIFKELIKKQLPDVPSQWKLNINDMKRICKYIDTSVFDKNACCVWNGYITNMNNSNKGTYVNFYFRNKKVALHRLLYSNFVAPLDSSEYLKFNCDNKGICCNINHYEKYKYSKNSGITKKKDFKNKEPKKEIKEIIIIGSDDPDKLIIDFD